MKSIKEIGALSGKRIIVRVDFNVPIKEGKVVDDFRIKKALPTIEYLSKKGARVLLIAHLGENGTESLKPIANILKKHISSLQFVTDSILSDETAKMVSLLKKGDVVLFENIRRERGEKENAPSFARAISRLGDFYVNDAFSVSHRAHASIIGITKYLPGFAGFQLQDEVKHLSVAFKPSHPFLFVLGGAKFETKIPLVKKFLRTADTVFIGGALMNDFFKVKGYETGASLVDDGDFGLVSLMKNKNLILPRDIQVTKGALRKIVKPDGVGKDETIVDVGPETVAMLEDIIGRSKFILWNGPLGKYESGFGGATEQILKCISKSKAHNIVGGGDTVALVSKLKLEKKLGFVSTGGGATLEFLAKGTLPGIKALK